MKLFTYLFCLHIPIYMLFAQENNTTEVSKSFFSMQNTKISSTQDDKGKTHPDILLNFNFTSHLLSSIEYRTTRDYTNSLVDGNYDSSNNDTTLYRKSLNLYLLKYELKSQSNQYYFGFGYSQESFDKNQIGYVVSSGTRYAFDNNIDITLSGISLYSNIILGKLTEHLSAKFDVIVLANSTLDVSQTTYLTGFPTGAGSSSQDLSLMYEMRTSFLYQIADVLKVSMEARYQFLPLKYNLELLQSDDTFKSTSYDVEESIIYGAIKISFNVNWLGDLNPTIGYIFEQTEGLNKLDNTRYRSNIDMLYLGLNSSF